MASKKTATKAPKSDTAKVAKKLKIKVPARPPRQDPRTCTHIDNKGGNAWTSFGVPQPANGDKLEVCLICGAQRNPNFNPDKPKGEVYHPPTIEAEQPYMFDMRGMDTGKKTNLFDITHK
jgi:hypothetical protein